MNGGTISGNTAHSGGGVSVDVRYGTFIKNGGSITADNRATSGRGHIADLSGTVNIDGMSTGNAQTALHNAPNWARNSAAGPSVNLNSRILGTAGGWDAK